MQALFFCYFDFARVTFAVMPGKEKELLRNFSLKNAMNNKIFITFAAEILTFYNIYC